LTHDLHLSQATLLLSLWFAQFFTLIHSFPGMGKGRAFSMTRLDLLAKPKRRNGEHISAIVERERRQALELENMQKASLAGQDKRKSRSMSQLGGKSREGSSQDRFKVAPLQRNHKNNEKTRSMTQLSNGEKKSPAKAGWDTKLS
jgi:hypothetical protein